MNFLLFKRYLYLELTNYFINIIIPLFCIADFQRVKLNHQLEDPLQSVVKHCNIDNIINELKKKKKILSFIQSYLKIVNKLFIFTVIIKATSGVLQRVHFSPLHFASFINDKKLLSTVAFFFLLMILNYF